MNFNYKLFFKYILLHTNQIFLKYTIKNNKNLNIYIEESNLYYTTLHIKLASIFYSIQLCEILAYEIPLTDNNNLKKNLTNNSLIIYNFHSITYQQRFFIISIPNSKKIIKTSSIFWNSINSITELYQNANWLEREISELHGIFFTGKKDLRNLMLTYGDTSAPMRKSMPSIGIKEIYYDSVTDLLVQTPVSIQF